MPCHGHLLSCNNQLTNGGPQAYPSLHRYKGHMAPARPLLCQPHQHTNQPAHSAGATTATDDSHVNHTSIRCPLGDHSPTGPRAQQPACSTCFCSRRQNHNCTPTNHTSAGSLLLLITTGQKHTASAGVAHTAAAVPRPAWALSCTSASVKAAAAVLSPNTFCLLFCRPQQRHYIAYSQFVRATPPQRRQRPGSS